MGFQKVKDAQIRINLTYMYLYVYLYNVCSTAVVGDVYTKVGRRLQYGGNLPTVVTLMPPSLPHPIYAPLQYSKAPPEIYYKTTFSSFY